MIEEFGINTIVNSSMAVSFIAYLIYDRKVVMKTLLESFNRLENKIDFLSIETMRKKR